MKKMSNYAEITEKNIDNIVKSAWYNVQNKVEKGHPLSSEKTLVFLFAFEVSKIVDNPNLVMDFENQCYNNIKGNSKYLDLLFYTDPNFNVAIEFKFPKKSSKGNSNQTQNRKKVYIDLARLKHLNMEKNYTCFFLMVVDEDAYLNNTNIKINQDFLTRQDHIITHENSLKVMGMSLKGIDCVFKWNNIEERNNKYYHKGKFAWLEPIKVQIFSSLSRVS